MLREASDFIFEVLAAPFQIAGTLLSVAGLYVLLFESMHGIALSLDDIGTVSLFAGVILFIVGTLISRTVEVEHELQVQRTLPPERGPSFSPPLPYTRYSRVVDCPKCGYTNKREAFFCDACNAGLWAEGTPRGKPPDRASVERRIERTIALRRAKRILILILITLAVCSPIITNAAAGYLVVSESSLTITRAAFEATGPGTNGTLFIAWDLRSAALGIFSNPTYIVSVNSVPRVYSDCPDVSPITNCGLAIHGISLAEVNGSVIGMTVSGVLRVFLYRQQITRSTFFACGHRCY